MISCACFSVQSFLRKFRSTLTRTPAARAALSERAVAATPFSPSAGVMPVTWIPLRAGEDRRPVDGVGLHLADRRARAVVDDRRGALAGAGLGVVDADAVAAAHDVVGPHALGAQRLTAASPISCFGRRVT